MDEYEIRKQMCDIGKRVWSRGMVAANDGNFSVKISDNEILCTPTGVSQGFVSKRDAAVGRGARVQRHDIFLLCHRGFSFLQQKIDPCLYYTGCSDFMRVAKPPNF